MVVNRLEKLMQFTVLVAIFFTVLAQTIGFEYSSIIKYNYNILAFFSVSLIMIYYIYNKAERDKIEDAGMKRRVDALNYLVLLMPLVMIVLVYAGQTVSGILLGLMFAYMFLLAFMAYEIKRPAKK